MADLNLETSSHYYAIALFNIPFDLPLALLAEGIAPRETSDAVRRLKDDYQARIVPHQLQVYKEPLRTKFGFCTVAVTTTLSPTAACASDREESIHKLVRHWIDVDLTAQMNLLRCQCHLAQPQECYHALDFINGLDQQCRLFKDAGDNGKLRYFFLSKVRFLRSAEARIRNTKAEESKGRWMAACAEFQIDSLGPLEVMWAKKNIANAPPILMTNNDPKTARMDQDAWFTFLSEGFAPLIRVR